MHKIEHRASLHKFSRATRQVNNKFKKFALIVGLLTQLSFVSSNRYFVCNLKSPMDKFRQDISLLMHHKSNEIYSSKFNNAVDAALDPNFEKRNSALCNIRFSPSALRYVEKNSAFSDTRRMSQVYQQENKQFVGIEDSRL